MRATLFTLNNRTQRAGARRGEARDTLGVLAPVRTPDAGRVVGVMAIYRQLREPG
jgi:hypothetical protein